MKIRKLNKIIAISIFILFICSLGAVSAADNNTTSVTSATTNSISSNTNITTINEVSTMNENSVQTASAESTGTYSDLQKLINSNSNSITLDKNYTYNAATDANYINGITISSKDYTINGNNFTINGANTARIINFAGTGTLTINNLNLINGKTTENGAAIDATNTGNILITGSNLANNNANQGGAVYTTGNVNIKSSYIINNTANIGSGVYAGTATIQYNIITGNSIINKVIYVTNTSKSNTNFNWWGRNEPEINTLTNVNTNCFVIASIKSYDSVMVNQTTPIEITLNSYTDGKKTYYLGVNLPTNYVKFQAETGKFTVTEGYLTDGTMTTIYTSPEIGIVNVTAKIDDQTVNFLLNVTEIPKNTLLYGYDFVEYFGEGQNYTIKLTDILGNPIVGQHLALNLTRLSNMASKVYWTTTDIEGYGYLQINLAPGLYSVQAFYSDTKEHYLNSAVNNSMKVLKVGLTVSDLIINYGETANYTVQLVGPNMTTAGQNISVKLQRATGGASATYYVITDENGTATLPISLGSGNYIATATYAGNSVTSAINISKGYTLTLLNWGTGGDITQNTVLYNYIKSTTSRGGIVDEIIALEKQGTVLIKFGNGNGKTVFINAGIHGNELPSQAAAYQMAEYLSGLNEINGTVYMICSLIPYTAQLSVREYNGVDPNRQANITGSVANRLIQLALSLNVQTFGDMHGTKAGGLPGENVIMAAYSPNAESATMANYMYSITHSSNSDIYLQIVDYAGQVYPTALQDNVNIAGIPAITGEVVCEHSTITPSSTRISYNFQIAFLTYNGFNVSFSSNPN